MYLKEYYPEPFFSKYIDSYFTIDSSLIHDDITDLVVPDGTFGLLFIEENNIGRSTSTSSPPITINRSTIFGQKTKPVNYYFSKGCTSAFGVKINPCGFHLFTGIDSKEFKDLFVEIELLKTANLNVLEQRIFDSKSIEEKIKVIEIYILNGLKDNALDEDHYIFENIVNYIYTLKGEVRFNKIAHHFNINYKKIERLFDKYLGISPKLYIRIVRFNAIINFRLKNQRQNLTQLGLEFGFFDQSHFIRDFKTFASLTPNKFFKKDVSPSEERYLEMLSSKW